MLELTVEREASFVLIFGKQRAKCVDFGECRAWTDWKAFYRLDLIHITRVACCREYANIRDLNNGDFYLLDRLICVILNVHIYGQRFAMVIHLQANIFLVYNSANMKFACCYFLLYLTIK